MNNLFEIDWRKLNEKKDSSNNEHGLLLGSFCIIINAEPINKVKLMPKNNAIKGDPIINAMEAKTIPNNKLIFFVVV